MRRLSENARIHIAFGLDGYRCAGRHAGRPRINPESSGLFRRAPQDARWRPGSHKGAQLFFFTYLRRELRRRMGRTVLTVLGLGVGVAMVVAITAVSNGLDDAQHRCSTRSRAWEPTCSSPDRCRTRVRPPTNKTTGQPAEQRSGPERSGPD